MKVTRTLKYAWPVALPVVLMTTAVIASNQPTGSFNSAGIGADSGLPAAVGTSSAGSPSQLEININGHDVPINSQGPTNVNLADDQGSVQSTGGGSTTTKNSQTTTTKNADGSVTVTVSANSTNSNSHSSTFVNGSGSVTTTATHSNIHVFANGPATVTVTK